MSTPSVPPAGTGTSAADVPPAQAALARLAREVEQHVASAGWDAPVRLFALVRTADAIARDPSLLPQLPEEVARAAQEDPEHLTAVEQEDLPDVERLEDLLARLAWPPTVDGVAVSVERSVLPPQAEAEVLATAEAEGLTEAGVAERLQAHPQRQDLRMVAAVMRGGANACAVRSRSHDSDPMVAVGPDLVPGLVEALAGTL
ncbi:MAG: PPA1309 family protein [Kineosporiaceae bacterium]